ncbi:ribonuclease J [Candidatus Poribacteria bacterium]|nr:ribonuclease J [Candidatus Poribacteria bacterium]
MVENQADYVSIIPLGGLGEFGMNIMAYECGDDIVVIDCGIMFSDDSAPGVDYIIPDISYLLQNEHKIRAVVITHAHEDHMGSLSFFLDQVNVPVYGTELTLAFAKERLRENKVLSKSNLNVITPHDSLELGCFKLEFVHMTHSIPSALAVVVKTPVGVIVHTSDFKFDPTPVDGKPSDIHKLAALGEKGVLLLLSDSTNADRLGVTPSERSIYSNLDNIFQNAEQRLFVCTFASSLHRVQQFIDLAVKHRRLIAVSGRSMIGNINIAAELDYLDLPHDLLIDLKDVNRFEPNETMILCTGSQGEPRSAMSLISRGDHASLRIDSGDTVLMSARQIPGNERQIGKMIGHIMRRGAHVIHEQNDHVHVSGHGAREDLKLMLTLTKPKFFVPIHGEYSNLVQHAELAESLGIPSQSIIVAETGDLILLEDDDCYIDGRVQSGVVFVDGKLKTTEDIVLRDRCQLATNGMVIPVVVISQETGELVGLPEIVSRGFVHIDVSEDLINEAKGIVAKAVDSVRFDVKEEVDLIRDKIRSELKRFLRSQTAQTPIILPVVMII